jgi:hypothetical protein
MVCQSGLVVATSASKSMFNLISVETDITNFNAFDFCYILCSATSFGLKNKSKPCPT